MAEAQLRKLRSLIEGMAANVNRKDTIECKHFFSGAAAYVNGRIFMTLTTAGLALKLPQDSRELLIGNGARPLRYFPKGPIKKDYVLVPRALVNDDATLASRIRESIRFAQTFIKAISPRAGNGSAKATRGLPP